MMLKTAIPILLATLLLSGCATTNRRDVRAARQDVREAQAYGDRGDVRDAKQELRKKKRDYRRDNHR